MVEFKYTQGYTRKLIFTLIHKQSYQWDVFDVSLVQSSIGRPR
uniref:Uncharacterized protein n=1 Tax=Anguilla anguilla TaxID=7936 RepID=A0A0E9XM28_ANGAN